MVEVCANPPPMTQSQMHSANALCVPAWLLLTLQEQSLATNTDLQKMLRGLLLATSGRLHPHLVS